MRKAVASTGGVAVALAKLNFDALTVATAVADVAAIVWRECRDGAPGRASTKDKSMARKRDWFVPLGDLALGVQVPASCGSTPQRSHT